MKTIILYDSIKGYTKKCAEYLHSNIEGSDIFDIDNRVFDLGDYDQVLIGAPIYVGEIEEIPGYQDVRKKVVEFLEYRGAADRYHKLRDQWKGQQ